MVYLFGILLSQVQRITIPGGQPPDFERKYNDRLIINGLSYVFMVGVVLCLITLTWSGVQWATAKKDKAKRARAKRRTLWLLAGLVAIYVAFFIFNILLAMFDVTGESWSGGLPDI